MSAAVASVSAPPPKKTSAIVTAYLFLFNVFSAAAWAYTLFLAVSHLRASPAAGLDKALGLWTAVAPALKIAQSAALFEVLHPMLGLVRSSVFTVFLQVLSRLALLWGVCNLAPASINNWGFAMMLLSWCAVEVPRYSFYALGLVTTNVPAPLVWLRYSLFLVLYPTGITGELLCIWAALPTLEKANYLNFPLPNALNMPFNYYALLFYGTMAYIPGAPFLFTHMIAARNKALSPPAKKEDGKKL